MNRSRSSGPSTFTLIAGGACLLGVLAVAYVLSNDSKPAQQQSSSGGGGMMGMGLPGMGGGGGGGMGGLFSFPGM